MRTKSSLLLDREILFDHLIYISKRIMVDWNRNRWIEPGSLARLKTLIEKAERHGIHGVAWQNIDIVDHP